MVSKNKKSNGNEESRVKEVYWEEWKDDTTTKVFWSKLTLERAQYLDTGSIMCQYKPAEGIDVSQKNYIKNISRILGKLFCQISTLIKDCMVFFLAMGIL